MLGFMERHRPAITDKTNKKHFPMKILLEIFVHKTRI